MPSTLSKPMAPRPPVHWNKPSPYVFFDTLENQLKSMERYGKHVSVKSCRLMVPLDTYNKLMDLIQLSKGEDSRFSRAKTPNECQEFYDSEILKLLRGTINQTFYSSRNNGKYYRAHDILEVKGREVTVKLGSASSNKTLINKKNVHLYEIGHDCMEMLQDGGDRSEKAGAIYHGVWYIKTWTPLIHHKFTQEVRKEIESVLSLLHVDKDKLPLMPNCLFHKLPTEVLYIIFGLLPFAPFKELKE